MSEEKQIRKERKVKIKGTERGLELRSLDEMWRFCVACAGSKEFKDIETPEQAFVRVQAGMELGMSPIWSLTSIMVVNGRPSVWGDGALALVLRHPDCQDVQEHPIGDPNDDTLGWQCTVYRRGREPKVGTFTIADAKRAQLWRKAGPWQYYSDRMLRMRARAFALRDSFADVLRGLSVVEEMRDVAPNNHVAREVKPLILPDEAKGVPDAVWKSMTNVQQEKEVKSSAAPVLAEPNTLKAGFGEARESTPSSTNDVKLGSLTKGESPNSRDGAKQSAGEPDVSNAQAGSDDVSGFTPTQKTLIPEEDDVPF